MASNAAFDVPPTRLGWTAQIELRPGDAAEDVYQKRARLASVFGVHASSVILTPGPSEAVLGIEVYETNPLQATSTFTTLTLNDSTGRCVIGHDTLGRPVHWEFWRPGWGACHGLVFGTTGSGKSALVQLLMTEVRHSGLGVVWFLDPEEGLSAPAWVDGANFYAGSISDDTDDDDDEDGEPTEAADEVDELANIRAGLQALERVWKHRRAHHSRARTTWKGPTRRWPYIFVVVDESPDVLKDDECKRILKLMLRKGRKVGITVVLIAQVPSLTELGGDQTVRSMAASLNVVAFRTSDKMSAHMGMPGLLPVDPVTLPEKWPDGEPTAGLAYLAGGKQIRTMWIPDDDAFRWASTGQPADLTEDAARRAGTIYLDPWLRRHGRDDEADEIQRRLAEARERLEADRRMQVAAATGDYVRLMAELAHNGALAVDPATAATLETARALDMAAAGQGPKLTPRKIDDRVLDALRTKGTTTAGVIHREVAGPGGRNPDLTQVCRSLRALQKRGLALHLGSRRWTYVAPLPAAATVGADQDTGS